MPCGGIGMGYSMERESMSIMPLISSRLTVVAVLAMVPINANSQYLYSICARSPQHTRCQPRELVVVVVLAIVAIDVDSQYL